MVAGVIKITTTIKTLILEILTGEGSGHIKEIHPLLRTLLMNNAIGQLKAIIIKIQHNCHSDRKNYSSANPFLIPIKHEYCLVFQK